MLVPVKNALRGGRESEDWGTPKGNPILIKTPQRHQARIYRGDFTERIWAGARGNVPGRNPRSQLSGSAPRLCQWPITTACPGPGWVSDQRLPDQLPLARNCFLAGTQSSGTSGEAFWSTDKAKPTTHSCPHSSGGTYNFFKGCHKSFSGSARPKENTEVMTAGYTCCQGACRHSTNSAGIQGRPPGSRRRGTRQHSRSSSVLSAPASLGLIFDTLAYSASS